MGLRAVRAHGLTALSLEDPEIHEDVDVNEVIRSLVSLVRLDDRTRGVVFSLNLASDVAPLSLSRRSVSLSLFNILSAAAASIQEAGGRVEVATSMSGAGEAAAVRIASAVHMAATRPRL